MKPHAVGHFWFNGSEYSVELNPRTGMVDIAVWGPNIGSGGPFQSVRWNAATKTLGPGVDAELPPGMAGLVEKAMREG